MDLALICSLTPSLRDGISRVLLSYDIACQWHKNLQTRLTTYNVSLPLPPSNLKYWRVAVPKFHLPGHGTECQVLYNLAYIKWAGRMDGERIEAGWSLTAPMATWTRESGPNARRGILDDHWNADNWRKLLGLRECSSFSSPLNSLTSHFQVSPLIGTSCGRLPGVNPSAKLRISYLEATLPTSSKSGIKCETTLILIPPCPTRTRKSKIVRLLLFVVDPPPYLIPRLHDGPTEAGAPQGGGETVFERGEHAAP